jgi:hypothetical protein
MKEETKKPNNSIAFSEVYTNGLGKIDSISGMSLLDYFAAKAMQGMWANPNFQLSGNQTFGSMAYETAYEMLKEREKHI